MKIKSAVRKKWVLSIYNKSFFFLDITLCFVHTAFLREKKNSLDVWVWSNHRNYENMRAHSPICFPESSECAQVTQTRNGNGNTQRSPSWVSCPPQGYLLSTHSTLLNKTTGHFPKGLPTSPVFPEEGVRRESRKVEAFREDPWPYKPTLEYDSLGAAHQMRHSDDIGESSTQFPGNLEKISQRKRAPSLF